MCSTVACSKFPSSIGLVYSCVGDNQWCSHIVIMWYYKCSICFYSRLVTNQPAYYTPHRWHFIRSYSAWNLTQKSANALYRELLNLRNLHLSVNQWHCHTLSPNTQWRLDTLHEAHERLYSFLCEFYFIDLGFKSLSLNVLKLWCRWWQTYS